MTDYKEITSTELKQNTKNVLNDVIKDKDRPYVVKTYKEPKVVIMSYEKWLGYEKKKRVRPPLSAFKKYMISVGHPIDTTKMIREMRDAE